MKRKVSMRFGSLDHQTLGSSAKVVGSGSKPVIPPSPTVDTAMSDTSTNAVQNKTIKKFVDDKNTLRLYSNSSTNIRFGIDSQGRYGYYKAGADTVTPFKTDPVLQSKDITPTSYDQDVVADTGYDALSMVKVRGVNTRTNDGEAYPQESDQTIYPNSGNIGLSKVLVHGAPLQEKEVYASTNDQIVTPDTGQYGLKKVTVHGAALPQLQEKTINPSTSTIEVRPDSGVYGLSKVTVNPVSLESKDVSPSTSDQIILPTNSIGLSSVTVRKAALEDIEIYPTINDIVREPSEPFYGFGKVTVHGVGSNVEGTVLWKNGNSYQTDNPTTVNPCFSSFGSEEIQLSEQISSYPIIGIWFQFDKNDFTSKDVYCQLLFTCQIPLWVSSRETYIKGAWITYRGTTDYYRTISVKSNYYLRISYCYIMGETQATSQASDKLIPLKVIGLKSPDLNYLNQTYGVEYHVYH